MNKKDFLTTPWQARKAESARMLTKYPERICAYVQREKKETVLPEIVKNKYLIPTNITIGQLIYVIRKRIKLPSEAALFIFVNNSIMPAVSETLGEVYKKYASDDGFLYITYAQENTFG